MQLPKIVEIRDTRVLTTKQLAEMYETTTDTITNFRYNKQRFVLGKHYMSLEGEELRQLKRREEFLPLFKQAKQVYVYTEKGALLHAKSLNTDKAWEVYDYLVDFYFRAKEAAPVQQEKKQESKPYYGMVVDVPENPKIQDALAEVRKYMTGLDVILTEYNRYRSRDSYLHYFMMLNELSVKLSGKIIDLLANEPNLIDKGGKKFDVNEVTKEPATKPHLLEFMKLASAWSREQQGRAVKLLQQLN